MDLEQLEYKLTLLKDKRVIVVDGNASFKSISYGGILYVTTNREEHVCFQVSGSDWSLLFVAEAVSSLEGTIIRLKPNEDSRGKIFSS